MCASSKHALEDISGSLSIEVAPLGTSLLVVEPGTFRTNFSSGGAANYIEPSMAYAIGENPVTQRFQQLRVYDGAAPGDPEKAAEVMFQAATEEGATGRLIKEEGLLRVIVGPDCWRRVDEKVNVLR